VKFSIVANPKHPRIGKILTKVIGLVDDFELESDSAKIVGLTGIPMKDLSGDIVISLGGDGTLLYIFSKINIPVFAINCGGVGFLTEIEEATDLFPYIQEIIKGNYELEKLQRIDTYLNDLHIGTALNEVVLHSSKVARIQGFEISIDNSIVDSFRGDGVVISTPTGSTSYAMSLGSPILYPTMESHIIIPIAAYRIGARPLVIPSKLTGNPEAVMVLDGQEEILVKLEDSIKLKKSKDPVSIVRFKDNFFDKVRTKLRL